MKVGRRQYIQWAISLVYTCTFLSTSAIAVPVNYFRLYLDASPDVAESLAAEPVIIVQEPPHLPERLLTSDDELPEFRAVTVKRSSEPMQRHGRNLAARGEKMLIQNVGDLPMFRFG
ncbi:hypothetical protein AAVH_12440 [Aphelenchoides avenae]|nr:hypothetical protein AAVH_12440 [Aphelenchus avenae]